MRIKLTEDTQLCPNCTQPLTVIGLRERLCNNCGVLCYMETDETLRTEEQMRRVTSRAYALEESGPKEVRGRW